MPEKTREYTLSGGTDVFYASAEDQAHDARLHQEAAKRGKAVDASKLRGKRVGGTVSLTPDGLRSAVSHGVSFVEVDPKEGEADLPRRVLVEAYLEDPDAVAAKELVTEALANPQPRSPGAASPTAR